MKRNGILKSMKTLLAALLCLSLSALPVYAQTVTSSSSGASYSATSGGTNAVLVNGNAVTLTNATVTKSGDTSGEDADFYGTNAAVLAKGGASLTINGSSKITSNGSHANAVFAYGSGSAIQISDAVITTKSSNSGGIMVTGGASLTASNLTVNTAGNSSAAIRSDRGGGTMNVTGGTYTTTGTGSPAIYSTAAVTVSNAALKSTASEGVVIEGANSVTLNNCTVYDSNTKLNGQSTTYKNIFLYQSMSGDAASGTSVFTANNSKITTLKGDTFYITNTTATINLSGNTFVNNSGDFLRAESAAWGKSGSNGGKVTLNASGQDISGNMVVAKNSTLKLNLTSGSTYSGAINKSGTKGTVKVSLASGCTWSLTADSYISSLSADSSQIITNGHTLYVNGSKYAGTGTSSSNKKGAKITDSKGNVYVITKKGSKKTAGTAAFAAPSSSAVTQVTIPATVKSGGITYKVTSIRKKALYGCTALQKAVIGKNVKTIGALAFGGCSQLSVLRIKSRLLTASTVKSQAFRGTPDTITVRIPSSKYAAYKKLLKKRGISSKAHWKKL